MNLNKYINSELSNWSPITNLRDQINRLYELTGSGRPAESFGDWAPALDAFEDKDKYVVSIELPGMKKEAINVTVHEGVLTISGERKSELNEKAGTVHRAECVYGKFSRSVSLPSAVKSDQVCATYKDGILSVEIPKQEEAKPKHIEVKVA